MKQTTSAFLTQQIKDAIIGGSYGEGSQLKQDDIAKVFGVSKIPIREALVQLESEGFVTSYPGRGVFVSRLSAEDARELYLLRIACEPVLLENALKNANAMMFARADSYLSALSVENLTPTEWHRFDREFHSSLYSTAGLPRIEHLVRSTHDNLARYFLIYESLGKNFHQVKDEEHAQLLSFAKHGDVDAAVSVLLAHLKTAFAELGNALKERAHDK